MFLFYGLFSETRKRLGCAKEKGKENKEIKIKERKGRGGWEMKKRIKYGRIRFASEMSTRRGENLNYYKTE